MYEIGLIEIIIAITAFYAAALSTYTMIDIYSSNKRDIKVYADYSVSFKAIKEGIKKEDLINLRVYNNGRRSVQIFSCGFGDNGSYFFSKFEEDIKFPFKLNDGDAVELKVNLSDKKDINTYNFGKSLMEMGKRGTGVKIFVTDAASKKYYSKPVIFYSKYGNEMADSMEKGLKSTKLKFIK